MNLTAKTLLWCFTIVGLSACGDSGTNKTPRNQRSKPLVHTVNYPLFYVAERIAGDLAEIRFAAPADLDPAFWDPSDETIAEMQNADLLLMNGATYAKWAEKVSLPTNTQVDTSSGFRAAYLTEEGAENHSHGDGTVHSHDGTAFTTWLDFDQARQQAEAVRDALIKQLPEASGSLQSNAATLIEDLKKLDESFQSISTMIKDRPLFASHPVYQYAARRYQLSIESFHWEPEVVPDGKALAELKDRQSTHPAKVMIWEGEPATASVKLLSDLGIRSIVVSPCGNRPEEGDWLTQMKANSKALSSVAE